MKNVKEDILQMFRQRRVAREEKSKQNIAFVVYCVSSHPDDKYGKIQIPEEERTESTKVFMGNVILQAIHVLFLP